MKIDPPPARFAELPAAQTLEQIEALLPWSITLQPEQPLVKRLLE